MPADVDSSIDHAAKVLEILGSISLSDPNITPLKNYLDGITELALVRVQLTDQDVQNLCQALQYNTSITILNLSDNDLGVQDIEPIVSVLQTNSTLRLLDITANHLGGTGISTLAHRIVNLPRDMSNPKFTLLAQNNGLVGKCDEVSFWEKVFTEQKRRFDERRTTPPAMVWYYPSCTSNQNGTLLSIAHNAAVRCMTSKSKATQPAR